MCLNHPWAVLHCKAREKRVADHVFEPGQRVDCGEGHQNGKKARANTGEQGRDGARNSEKAREARPWFSSTRQGQVLTGLAHPRLQDALKSCPLRCAPHNNLAGFFLSSSLLWEERGEVGVVRGEGWTCSEMEETQGWGRMERDREGWGRWGCWRFEFGSWGAVRDVNSL